MKSLLDRLKTGEARIAVVGLGYVGLPLAVGFAERFSVIGFDSNKEKVDKYLQGIDPTEELEDGALASSTVEFASNPDRISEASFVIVAVPTPIHGDKTPDLAPLKSATETVGKHLSHGSIVVYESTVYPGVTEEICRPILERESGMECGKDFKIGYSPERINPGDMVHRLRNITKIVSGMDDESLEIIASVYNTIIEHVYRAPSIRVAEAAKLVENAQRDINIAFMNELAMVFHRMGLDTHEVVKAMETKWNALGFRPGLVGGHCIGVDPYYFIYKAQNLGYYSQIISAGRRINNSMSEFIVQEAIKMMVLGNIDISCANVYLFGMTFKENCPDTRNSRSFDIYKKFSDYGVQVKAVDPYAEESGDYLRHEIALANISEVKEADCLLVLVAHKEFCTISMDAMKSMMKDCSNGKCVLMDVKNIFSRKEIEKLGYMYWSL